MSLVLKKSNLRKKLLQDLRSIPTNDRDAASKTIHAKLMAETRYQTAELVGLFISMSHEVDTRQIIRDSLTLGKRVFVPRTDGKLMTMLELQSSEEIDAFPKTRWGIPEPPNDGRKSLDDEALPHTVLLIVPGVAFNIDGRRMGYGGGYYDRYLTDLSAKTSDRARVSTIAIGFRRQLIEEQIPVDSHDVKIDCVLTD